MWSPTNSTFAWNHGDVQEDIIRSWLAMAGPGVRHQGRDDSVFSDHADVRPTMLALVGLKDSYVHDGRVLAEKIDEKALPDGIHNKQEHFIELANLYKQLNAPVGSVGLNSLIFANRSIIGDDATYAQYLATMGTLTSDRDALASQIRAVLAGAAFANTPVSNDQAKDLGGRASDIINRVEDLAGTQ